MRRLFLFCFFVFASVVLYAQKAENNVSRFVNNNQFVINKPQSIIYKIPLSWLTSNKYDQHRCVVDYDNYETKKLKKPQALYVRGLVNRHGQLGYDTYIVDYKGLLYFLPDSYVTRNDLIWGINASLSSEYNMLKAERDSICLELDSFNFRLDSLNSIRSKHIEECEMQIACYSLERMVLQSVIDSLANQAREEFRAHVQDTQKKVFRDWYDALPQSAKNAYSKLSIEKFSLESPNSASGCDCIFTYVNKSEKTIKYLYWEGAFYNAVDDPVFCEIRNSCTIRGKDTGPIAPGKVGGGVWDCVIYNWTADYVKLTSIEIVYMDGSTTKIGANDIRLLQTPPSPVEVAQQCGSEHDAIDKATRLFEEKLRECNLNENLWQKKLKQVTRGASAEGEYSVIVNSISILQKKKASIDTKIEKFEKENLIR